MKFSIFDFRFSIVLLIASCACGAEIGVRGGRFEIDRKGVFLMGCSYYGGVGGSD